MIQSADKIRNFVITAHIDHGKSTLADRLLEITGTVEKRLMKPQYLDQLELERERGITIKMAPVRMKYKDYTLNLIDTPGHSDFSYEVSRALEAVEGAVLLVDATQGIQAQTLANFESAKRAKLKIIGVVNKIDVAEPEQISAAVTDLASLIGDGESDILKVSGKTGDGVEKLLEEIVKRVPAPRDIKSPTTRALIFDSLYDDHKGVIAFVRVFDGEFITPAGKNLRLMATGANFKPKEIGYFAPQLKIADSLRSGEIGYIATGIKDPGSLKIGDTVAIGEVKALPGYREPKPVVFVSFYPEEGDKYDEFKAALGKLRLTDSALVFEPEKSEVLGRGFKGGFLGRLHFEIAAERLAREFRIETVHSFPSVAYEVDGVIITDPKDFPNDYSVAKEPMTKIEIVLPPAYIGAVLQLKEIFRFSKFHTETLKEKIILRAKLPLADLVRDLDDKLKSVTQGFASFSYEIVGYEPADVSKLEILVTGQIIPGLTRILPKKDVEREARYTAEKLKELLPKQQFIQAIQAVANGRVIARETIPAAHKLLGNFGKTGGDRTRKMKLWKKQERGKERLQERAGKSHIKIPSAIFKELLKK